MSRVGKSASAAITGSGTSTCFWSPMSISALTIASPPIAHSNHRRERTEAFTRPSTNGPSPRVAGDRQSVGSYGALEGGSPLVEGLDEGNGASIQSVPESDSSAPRPEGTGRHRPAL